MSTIAAGNVVPVFVQIIQAPVADADDVRDHFDHWFEDLVDDATGWLGTTAGTTDEGELFAAVRFVSTEAARRNSQREEQDAWWQELLRRLADEPVVHSCSDVAEIAGGASDHAGYVQVVQGRASNLSDVLHDIARGAETTLPHRPTLLGGYLAAHDEGGGFSEVMYYPTVEAAEAKESEQLRESRLSRIQEKATFLTDVRRLKFIEPWLYSA